MILQSENARAIPASDVVRQSAAAAVRSGDLREAERMLREYLQNHPADVAILRALADMLHEQGRLVEVLFLLQRALVAAPANGFIRFDMARLLDAQGQSEAALLQIEKITGALRSDFPVRALEAALLGKLGMHDREIGLYEDLVRQRPDHPALWMSLGNALKYVGRTKEASSALRRSIEVRSTYGEGWWNLANLKTVRFRDSDVSEMRRALRSRPSMEDELHLHFALGKAFEERGDFGRSFRHYADGNRIRAAVFKPEQTTVRSFVDQAIEIFDEALFERCKDSGNDAEGPIFIVGLQRSGSTLIEQILASHPLIEGTSELLAMQQVWADIGRSAGQNGTSTWQAIRDAEPAWLAEIGENYLKRARPYRRTDRPLFIDKLPANWMMAGLIRLALPNARIIDARRHPLACGFSNFKQHYATGVAFAYNLETIGRFYVDYLRLMDHFDRLQPGAIHHVLNEKLIQDPEGEVRRLLDFVGAPFDPACLEFHRTKRAVNTPSAEQVRRPINRDGVDAWRNYELWLAPLKHALGSALENWDLVL